MIESVSYLVESVSYLVELVYVLVTSKVGQSVIWLSQSQYLLHLRLFS